MALDLRVTSYVSALALLVAGLVGAQTWSPTPAAAAPEVAAGPTVVDDAVVAPASKFFVYLPGATDDVAGSSPIRGELTVFPAGQLDTLPPGSTISDEGRLLELGDQGDLSNRRFTVDPADGSLRFGFGYNYSGTTTVRYRVTDAAGASDEGTATVVVQGGANDDFVTTPQNVTVSIDVLANDTPGRNADGTLGSLVSTSVGFPTEGQPAGALVSAAGRILTVPEVGVFTADPQTGHVTFDPVLTYVGARSPAVPYTVQDTVRTAEGAVVHQTLVGYIYYETNRVVPNIRGDAAQIVFGTSAYLRGVLNDEPGDPAVPLRPELSTFVRSDLERLPAGSTLSADGRTMTVVGQGVWSFYENGAIAFVPVRGFQGQASDILYLAYDANLTSGFAILSVLVRPGPWSRPDRATTAQNVNTLVDVLANDVPGENDRGRSGSMDPTSVHFELQGQPAGAKVYAQGRVLAVPREGVYTVQWRTGQISFDPAHAFVGTASPVTYRARDTVVTSQGFLFHNPTHAALTVTVTRITPVAVDNWSNTEVGKAVYVRVLGNDRPGAASAPLVPSSVRLELGPGLPRSSTVSADHKRLTVPGRGVYTVRTDGLVVVVPAPGFAGVVPTVRYTVSDTNGTTASATVTVGVQRRTS